MNLSLFITITLTGFCGFGLLASIMLTRTSRVASRRALTLINGQHARPRKSRKVAALRGSIISMFRWLASQIGMADDPRLMMRFEQAGIVNSSYRDLYLGVRVAMPLVALALASLISYKRSFWMLSLTSVAYLIPEMFLTRLVKGRRERIRLSVPDAIDLLVICVDAGLGMDQAMLRVALELGKRHPDLHQELLRINREQRAGKARMEAWRSMALRTELPDINAFVNMLLQTERFGTPIARALSNFAEGIREKRRQRAEELAAKTTVKIIFPLVLCIFPSIFIVLLGPPGIAIARGLASSSN